MKKNIFLINGGIGDILLSFSGIEQLIKIYGKENLYCILMSHYKDAKKLIEHFGFDINFYSYNSNDELVALGKEIEYFEKQESYLGDISNFCNTMFPTINIPEEYVVLAEEALLYGSYDLVGIHPFGSKFSNDFLTNKRNVASKNMSIETVLKLILQITKQNTHERSGFVIFGSRNEMDFFTSLKKRLDDKYIVIPSFNNDIWISFALAETCNAIIASDSAIKSFSCIKKIPTTVFLGDYEDKVRDEKFINPYVESGTLRTVKFSDKIKQEHIDNAVENTLEFIKYSL